MGHTRPDGPTRSSATAQAPETHPPSHTTAALLLDVSAVTHYCCIAATQEDGSTAEGVLGGRLRDRVCYLKTDHDWDCLKALIKGVDAAIKDSREMIVKCHANFVELKPLQSVLGELAQEPKRQASHLKPKDVKPALDKYYSESRTKDMDAFLEKDECAPQGLEPMKPMKPR